MAHDICGCETSLTAPPALAAWNAMTRAFLAHAQSTPDHLGAVFEHAPDYAMAHAARGLFSILMAKRELMDVAHNASQAAQNALALGGASPRERLWCHALQDWLNGSPRRAIECMEHALRLNPADTLSMKMGHAIRFVLGDNHGMRRSIEAVLDAHDADHPLRGYALGCHAFALEETGEYAAAERTGLDALIHAPDDAWGLHAVAHVYDMTHRAEDGIALISGNQSAWSHCNNFRFHVWWHQALLHLDRGDHDLALTLYDDKIRAEKTDDYRDISNATSLLSRLELDGINVGARWEELADLSEARANDSCLVFADLHYMLALAGDARSDAAARMTARVARDAQAHTDLGAIMRDPGLATATGLSAFGEADYARAFVHLSAAQPSFQTMGGSHAQRDVFERITIEAGLRAGHLDSAERLLTERTALRAGTPDRFAETRSAHIAQARDVQPSLAAE